MPTYVKYIIKTYFKSFIFTFITLSSLVFILNLLGELDFFKQINVESYFPAYLSLLNMPSLVFELFPFIILISSQFFFINIFKYNQIQIFKYTGLKNSHIIFILTLSTFLLSLLIITLFYNLSSNLKSFYLQIKSNYTNDGKYLAVITKNGLWIKDIVDDNIIIVNASKMDNNFLVDSYITEFDKNYDVIRNISSQKIDIKNNEWIIYEPIIYKENRDTSKKLIKITSNFTYKMMQTLFSNLSSLSLIELYELKKNYKLLNYSTTDVDIQMHKLISYPLYLMLMTILASIIMFSTKNYNSSTLKIVLGLFCSVLVYYVNNFFNVLGNTEKISVLYSVWTPLVILTFINSIMIYKINEK